MIKTFRERIRESVQEINKKYNPNFTIIELEKRLGSIVDKKTIEHTLSELKMEELEKISGGSFSVYNPRLITSAVLALAIATGCVKPSTSETNLYSSAKNALSSTERAILNKEENESLEDSHKKERETCGIPVSSSNNLINTFEKVNKEAFIPVPPKPPIPFKNNLKKEEKVSSSSKPRASMLEEIRSSSREDLKKVPKENEKRKVKVPEAIGNLEILEKMMKNIRKFNSDEMDEDNEFDWLE